MPFLSVSVCKAILRGWTSTALRTVVSVVTGVLLQPPAGGAGLVDQPTVRVGATVGETGDVVVLPLVLDTAGRDLAGVLVDIALPGKGIVPLSTASGRPDCIPGDEAGKPDSAFKFRPHGCILGENCTDIRAVILSFSDSEPIPDGVVLFTCRFSLFAPFDGTNSVPCLRADGSTPDGGLVQLGCDSGAIYVEPFVNYTPTPTRTPSVTRTPSRTGTPTATATSTRTGTATSTATITLTATSTDTPTPTASPTATDTPTATPTASATASPSASATPTPIRCVGDCDGDGTLTVAELVRGVAIALGNLAISACPAFDRNLDREVAVFELINAVNNALGGCTPPPELAARRAGWAPASCG